jgi:hypothetical protein
MEQENKNILDKIIDQKENEVKKSDYFIKLVNDLLSLIKPRESEILRLRAGLHDGKKNTLEGIGKKMNLTRERVRQLESSAKENIKKHKNFDGITAPAKNIVVGALRKHGGVSTKGFIIDHILSDSIDDGLNSKNANIFLEFLVDNFINEIRSIDHERFQKGWFLEDGHLDFASNVVEEISKLVEERQDILREEDLIKQFKDESFYQTNKEKLDEFLEKNEDSLQNIIKSYLEASKGLDRTPFDQWGIHNWRSIKPKRINDKIYLVLDWYGQPMHFQEISNKINDAGFDHKRAHPATIHNDLIADDRFVLIGRGVYALKNWGYKDGTVVDVVEDILKEKKEALTREDVVKEVLKQREVKPNTIYLALNRSDKINKTSDGKYIITNNA